MSKENNSIDSYEKFFQFFKIGKEDFYQFGLKETIFPLNGEVEQEWQKLKHRIYNNGRVSIRGYGRDAAGTSLYLGLYKYLFHNENVIKDPTNNYEPQRIISNLTGYKRNKDLFNYQVSHIFGRTKNIFMFEAPWNIAFVPKIIDPLTGHETKGKWPLEYQERFIAYAFDKYVDYVFEYNELVTDEKILKGIAAYIDELKDRNGLRNEIMQFEKDVYNEFSIININNP